MTVKHCQTGTANVVKVHACHVFSYGRSAQNERCAISQAFSELSAHAFYCTLNYQGSIYPSSHFSDCPSPHMVEDCTYCSRLDNRLISQPKAVQAYLMVTHVLKSYRIATIRVEYAVNTRETKANKTKCKYRVKAIILYEIVMPCTGIALVRLCITSLL